MAKATKPTKATASEVEETVEPQDVVKVRSTLTPKKDGGDVVVLWEQDDAHPGGQAFIAGPAPVEVALTPAVSKLLRDGVIEEVV